MKTARLTELPVKHLEYVFSPPGLPLPAKGQSDLGTTSILVRGGAGTGKTTFALALAHAAAKAGGGLVLYLTTEFSPVEITFKATLIGLPEDAVDVWPGSDGVTAGGVVVEHLSEVRQGKPVLSSAERRRSSIDAVWGLLHPQEKDAAKTALPVRAVVIDALTLPDPGENDGAQRADLVAFVQALENEGVLVVLVEELAPGAAAWSSFVVDVVFELAFQPDPETQDLRRKLTLSKCRYALSIPGPHDYGLESGIPAVWPDLFRVVTIGPASTNGPLSRTVPPRLALPLDEENKWVSLNASVILSPYDITSMDAPRVLDHTPGAKMLSIRCRGRTLISASTHTSYVNEDDGVHAIGWAALSSAKLTGTNICFFNSLERLLKRPDSTARVSRLLEALRLMGFMVCVHSPRDAISPLDATADHIWDRTKHVPLPLRLRRHRDYASTCFTMPWMKDLGTAADQTKTHVVKMPADFNKYEIFDGFAPEAEQPPTIQDLRSATEAASTGRNVDKQTLESLVNAEGILGHHAAWFALHSGADWHAARGALAAVETEKPEPTMLLLWKAICAAIACNISAIDELKALVASPDVALILDPLLRGLAGTNQLEVADRIIAEIGSRHGFAPWMLARLSADVRLGSGSPAVLRDAAARLLSLSADESLPSVHRAEVCHNLGTAQDRLGQREAAIISFERAFAINPFLDAAREEIERLQSSDPAPS